VEGSRALPGTGMIATGNRRGNFAGVQTRVAYDLAAGAVTIEPGASLAYVHTGQAGFTESGASLLDLAYSRTATDTVEGRLTVRAARHFAVSRWGLEPWVEAGVREMFSGLARGVVATDGTVSSSIAGVSPAPTAGVIGVGLSAAPGQAVSLFVRYQGQFSANQIESAFSAGLSVRF
jgi:outer membrane autotransporter protein